MEFLSYSSEQLKQYFQILSNEEKIADYKRLLKDAKNILENSRDDIDQLKKLSKAAVVIEEITDKELLKKFNDDNPLTH
jgi:glutaredoxin 2